MILVFNSDKFDISSENLKRVEKLNAFTYGHICVARSVQEEKRSMNFVSVEKRTLLGEEVRIIPWIGFGRRDRVI